MKLQAWYHLKDPMPIKELENILCRWITGPVDPDLYYVHIEYDEDLPRLIISKKKAL